MTYDQSGEMKTPEKEIINDELVRYYKKFRDEGHSNPKEFLLTWDIPGDAERPNYFWQKVEFGPRIEAGDDALFRGYLMTTTSDIPKVLEILSQLGEKREIQDQSLFFKWLGIVNGMSEAKAKKYNAYAGGPQVALGDYEGLADTMPLVTLYDTSREGILETLKELAADPRWEQIERHRIAKFGDISSTPIRPTTSIFTDAQQREWRSLNYLPSPGFSDNPADAK
jgi:hypothetical protein